MKETVLENLDELVIILTDKPHIFNSLENIDLSTISATMPIPTFMGRFGFNPNITENNLELASKLEYSNHGYMILKK
jgi:hypothetical protein